MIDSNYKEIIETVLKEGYLYDDPNRKGVKRLEIPSYTFRHDFKDGFPAISTKKLAFKSVVTELLWFLKGDTNIKYLLDNDCNIWNKDAYSYYLKECNKLKMADDIDESLKNFINIVKKPKDINSLFEFYNSDYKIGDLGKVYGHYWRNFNGVDQIAQLIDDMINKPMSSELLVVARDPSHKEEQALPCCHYGFQIVMKPLSNKERLEIWDSIHLKNVKPEDSMDNIDLDGDEIPKYGFELHWKQRSCDLFLGIPFNIASYALLALILEKITGHKALGIQGDLKKVHLYDNSIDAAKELIQRECSKEITTVLGLSGIGIHPNSTEAIKTFEFLKPSDFSLENYNPQPPLRVEMLSRN